MPELPEVETVRRGLERAALGATIAVVEVSGKRSVRRQNAATFANALVKKRIVELRRRGKYLVVGLDSGAQLVCHLRMSGQLLLVAQNELRPAHTHAVLSFDDGRELRFVDPRTFGELFVTDDLDEERWPTALSGLGADPLEERLNGAQLFAMTNNRRTSLKAFLLDQHHIAGIGSLYADEICFSARLLPARRTDSLTKKDTNALARAIEQVLVAAVEARGSSLSDEGYRDLFGALGSYQDDHAVYKRAGAPCRRCGAPVRATRVAGRSAHYCEHCQV